MNESDACISVSTADATPLLPVSTATAKPADQNGVEGRVAPIVVPVLAVFAALAVDF